MLRARLLGILHRLDAYAGGGQEHNDSMDVDKKDEEPTGDEIEAMSPEEILAYMMRCMDAPNGLVCKYGFECVEENPDQFMLVYVASSYCLNVYLEHIEGEYIFSLYCARGEDGSGELTFADPSLVQACKEMCAMLDTDPGFTNRGLEDDIEQHPAGPFAQFI